MNKKLIKELINELKTHNKLLALEMSKTYHNDLLPNDREEQFNVLLPIANKIIEFATKYIPRSL